MTTTQLRPHPDSTGRQLGDTRIQSKASAGPKGGAGTLRPLILDLAIPLGSYYILHAAGCSLVMSLAVSSILPAARSMAGLIRNRSANFLAMLIVAVNVVSIAITFLAGDPRIMVAKDGAVSSTIGIAILISAFTARPLMTAGLRPFLVKTDAARAVAFDRLLTSSPRFRKLERLFSAIWGVSFITECTARVICAFTLPVATMVWLGTVMTVGCIGIGVVAGSFCSIPMETMVKLEEGVKMGAGK
jgi:hypothetical protein